MSRTSPDPTEALDLPKAPARRRWVSVALTLVVLVSGMIVGAGSALLFVRHRALMRLHRPQEAVDLDTARLQKALGLSDEQADKIRSILLARQAAVFASVQKELDGLEDDVAQVLDDHQRPVWHEKLQWFRKTWVPRANPPSR